MSRVTRYTSVMIYATVLQWITIHESAKTADHTVTKIPLPPPPPPPPPLPPRHAPGLPTFVYERKKKKEKMFFY